MAPHSINTATIDKVLEMLTLTNNGQTLAPESLAIIQASLNPLYGNSFEKQFPLDMLYQSIKNQRYLPSWFADTQFLTADNDGYIYYKGYRVEHVHSSVQHIYKHLHRPADLVELCEKCEAIGLTPSIKTLHLRSLWGSINSPFHPFLFFVENFARIYQWRTDLIILHTMIPLSVDTLYRFRMIKTEQLEHTEDSVRLDVPFDYYIRDNSFQKVDFPLDKPSTTDQWKEWMTSINFKLWYMNPEAYWDFMLKSMAYGHTIEVPESIYNHFLNCVPPFKMNHQEDGKSWFLCGEPVSKNTHGTSYHAFSYQDNKFFGKIISIPNQ
jgi:hypothetical protein